MWLPTAEAMQVSFGALNGEISDKIAGRAEPLAQSVLFRIATAGILGVISLIATVFVSFAFSRRLSSELGALQQAASALADERLPRVVERLRRGEDVDVEAETPPMLTGGNTVEVENLGNAFTSVQHTAIEAAVGQAELRKGVNKVFLNLARRSQSLLHRQLAMLDGLEQQVTDPDLLEKLFGVDHLTTRMRRHSEGLIILSGAAPGRGWRNPVSLFDVVRASVEEVEDYLRVSVSVPHGPALIGTAVTDVIHLVAELVENATIFSPPHTQVFVRGEPVARGFVLEVEDRGLGINREELTHLNHRLANPPEFDLADSDRLGLFVVGRLAERHGIRVSLQPSPYGGTTAIVLIPQEVVVEATESEYSVEQLVSPQPAPAPALALTPPVGDEDSLPKRVRQANLAPQLREEPRDVLSSFQAGWKRGKEES
jgi:signal transduction histidine kinase